MRDYCIIVLFKVLLHGQVQGQFLQNGPYNDAMYSNNSSNNYNNHFNYNNFDLGYAGNRNNNIDRFGQNNQYIVPPPRNNIRADFLNQQNYQFNQNSIRREGFGAQEVAHHGGGQVMAWDLRDKNAASWGRVEWDSWFDELEVELGFRQVGPTYIGDDNQINRRNGGPQKYNLNWPEWQNDPGFKTDPRYNNNESLQRTATYPTKQEFEEHGYQEFQNNEIDDDGILNNNKDGNDDNVEASMSHGFHLLDPSGKRWPEMKGRLSRNNDVGGNLSNKEDDDFGILIKSYYLRRRKDDNIGEQKKDQLLKRSGETEFDQDLEKSEMKVKETGSEAYIEKGTLEEKIETSEAVESKNKDIVETPTSGSKNHTEVQD